MKEVLLPLAGVGIAFVGAFAVGVIQMLWTQWRHRGLQCRVGAVVVGQKYCYVHRVTWNRGVCPVGQACRRFHPDEACQPGVNHPAAG